MDNKSQIVIFVSASMDRQGKAYSSTQLSEIYNTSKTKMHHLLRELVKEKRLTRIMLRRTYFYGPGYMLSNKPEVVKPIRKYDKKRHNERQSFLHKLLSLFWKRDES